MRFPIIVFIMASLLSGCKKEDSPLSPIDQHLLTVRVENDSLIYSFTIPKFDYSPGDSLNTLYAIENKTNHVITFTFDSSDFYYSVFNDSSRVIMSYPKQFTAYGFFAALPNGGCGFAIPDPLHDDFNIPIHAGLYHVSGRVEDPAAPTLTLEFRVK